MNAKRNALGKGLSALLESTPGEINASPGNVHAVMVGAVASLLIEKIEPNPFQPRSDFEETALKELSDSIRQQGVIQPITVRKMGQDHYQIISGERRWRAARMAGLDYIPAYVRIANDESMLEMALVENIQRENLNPIEIAISYQRLIDECSLTIDQLALKVGKDRSTVSNFIRLLKLPALIQAAIRDGKITMGHARAMINVNDASKQLKIFHDVMANNLSVRRAEELVRSSSGKKNSVRKAPVLAPEIKSIQDRLSGLYETKVEIHPHADGSGRISIAYFSTSDLNRLLDMLDT